VASVPPELTPTLQTATSGIEVGTTGLSCSDRTGSWAGLQGQARSFTRAGTGVVTAAAVAALLQFSCATPSLARLLYAKNHVFC